MSGSGSTTPTPNLPSQHTTTPTPDPTTSRQHHTLSEHLHGPSHQHEPLSPTETREMRMHSPTSSSSPGDLADTEEHSTSQHSEQPTMGEPPKKKRTRMLLTPYQSSVLSALFAQSRFPTTAMREEVGRSIGLSARKVQIWFQNQRQKAKRPRSQTGANTSRPPQYGPFTNVPPSGSEGSIGLLDLGMPGMFGRTGMSMHDAPLPSGLPMTIALNEAGQPPSPQSILLSGPGVPGSSGERPVLPPLDIQSYHGPSSRHSGGSGSSYGHSASTRYSPYEPTWVHHGSSGSASSIDLPSELVLPPLRLDSSTRRGSFSAPPTSYAGPSMSHYPLSPTSPVSPASSPFTHQPPDVRIPMRSLPPPFTLQPTPIWDPAMFSPTFSLSRRPHTSHDTLALSARGRSSTPIGRLHTRSDRILERPDFLLSVGQTRQQRSDDEERERELSLSARHSRPSHRYDPIGASGPRRPRPTSHSPRPSRSEDNDHDED